jgi:hypothetical protein
MAEHIEHLASRDLRPRGAVDGPSALSGARPYLNGNAHGHGPSNGNGHAYANGNGHGHAHANGNGQGHGSPPNPGNGRGSAPLFPAVTTDPGEWLRSRTGDLGTSRLGGMLGAPEGGPANKGGGSPGPAGPDGPSGPRRTVMGFAWLVFPADPDDPELSGYPLFLDNDGKPITAGVVFTCPVEPTDPGIVVDREGATFLILTETLAPPPIEPGWDSAPAKIRGGFQAEQGEVLLKAVAGALRSSKGLVLRCELEVADEPA